MKFNKLSPAEEERLAKLTEECGEISQMVGKTLVHGWASYHPRDPEQVSNRAKLEKEVGGLLAVVDIMIAAADLNPDAIESAKVIKAATIWKYLHHQGEYHGL